MSLSRILRMRALDEPDRRFCTLLARGVATELSFGDLYGLALAAAFELRDRGVSRGDVVVVSLRHGANLFGYFLGAVLLGAVPSFMPFPSPKQDAHRFWHDHLRLFARVRPRLLVTYRENAPAAESACNEIGIPVLVATEELRHPTDSVLEADLPGLTASADDLACLQHSSGTTGLKKGVMLTHGAIERQVAAYSERLRLTQADVIASWLPLYHDMGFVACFLMPIVSGVAVVALDPFEWVLRPSSLLEAISTYRATLCWQPNFAFSHLVNTARPSATFDLSTMRAFINCSEPCKPAAFSRFLERFAGAGLTSDRLQVCYAMAENVFAVTQTVPDAPARVASFARDPFERHHVLTSTGDGRVEFVSCGTPIAGVDLEIRDATGGSLAAGRVGEVTIRSPYLFDGYYLQPEVTEERLKAGWYRTGDLGFLDCGELFITGRLDDMIIVNGRNYYAHEIEDVISLLPGVVPGRSVAIQVDDDSSGAAAVAVIAEYLEDRDPSSLATTIKNEVFDSMTLALRTVAMVPRGSLVKTTSGKMSRSENRRRFIEGAFASMIVR
jgi:acyl-CoA synthetase (AMP-forming)/AMP-acid ligase II